MTVFWVVAALLIGAALLFVVPPLLARRPVFIDTQARERMDIELFREQLAELENDLNNGVLSADQFEQAHSELEHRLLEDVAGMKETGAAPVGHTSSKGTAVFVGLAIPAAAISMYLVLGNPAAMLPATQAASAQTGHLQTQEQILAMVQNLAARLEQNPDDAEGWAILGRSLLAMQQYQDATVAFENAAALVHSDAQLYADYADALAMASGEQLVGKPMQLIRRALEVDPNNQKALWLAGTAAYESGNYDEALTTWKHLQGLLAPGSEAAETMARNVGEVEQLMRSGASQPAAPAAASAAAADRRIAGTVTLSPALQARVAPGDAVFVFARASSGPPMPLAAQRITVADLPYMYSLDDSLAVMPQMKLSDFAEVIVMARISKAGNATRGSGDLEGASGVVALGSENVQVSIDSVVP
ncbi:MAG: hypothetical protein FD165_1085 [Gammaproteobacteria bacterium]|nr:MAG: hypothetical protein FD165_1085 [Gammaproteobacteria bacterium]TND06207.1 MAG: hypothetical protein FD120_694 [Gammaproteobacteria bacterium]